jgi:serine/threonine-protein kinase
MRRLCAFLALATLAGTARAQPAAPDVKKLTDQALAILKDNCHRCHGGDGSNEGAFNYALDVKQLLARRKVVPGDLKKSRLFRRVSEGDMPPDGEKPRPSAADVALLKSWILALGKDKPPVAEAEPPKEPKRAFVSAADNLEAIRKHLKRTPRTAQRYQRYFTFTHLHNDPAVTAADLRLRHAALSKLLNSLSWKAAVVLPYPVDEARTVWGVDVRKLDWDRHGLWAKVLAVYPYGLSHERYPDDAAVNQTARDVESLARTNLPAVRADWFLATASRPPLYHDLLRLPKHAGELERLLKVDVADNFRRGQLARAGFTTSGVSRHNRLVERHEAAYGAYWKSYDFKSSDGRGSLVRFPLGPAFKGNRYADKAFEHAGGEIIFHLPNGLQGYLLVDDKDRRIDEGPTEVVRDKTETAGSVAVVNGLSCMSCHQHGMIKDFKDDVRTGTRLGGDALDKVRELYPPAEEMRGLLEKDEARFLNALDRATGLFLKVGKESDRDVKDFKEVMGPVARSYLLTEVDAAAAAREVGLKDKATLEAAIKANRRLQRLGLLPLARGGAIKREVWESLKGLYSPAQETARVLELGTPQREK